MAQSSSSQRLGSGVTPIILADAGDHLADRAVGEVGVVTGVLEPLIEIVKQGLGGLAVAFRVDGAFDRVLDELLAARASGGGLLREPLDVAGADGFTVVGQPGLQRQGLAHGPGDAGEGEDELRVARLDRLRRDGARQRHAEFPQLLQDTQVTFGARFGGIGGFGRWRCAGHEQNKNTRKSRESRKYRVCHPNNRHPTVS